MLRFRFCLLVSSQICGLSAAKQLHWSAAPNLEVMKESRPGKTPELVVKTRHSNEDFPIKQPSKADMFRQSISVPNSQLLLGCPRVYPPVTRLENHNLQWFNHLQLVGFPVNYPCNRDGILESRFLLQLAVGSGWEAGAQDRQYLIP